jgi:hypothetical protein
MLVSAYDVQWEEGSTAAHEVFFSFGVWQEEIQLLPIETIQLKGYRRTRKELESTFAGYLQLPEAWSQDTYFIL